MIGSLGFVWVAAWLFFVRGERRGVLAYPHAKEPPAQEWRPVPAGLSRVAMVAFGAIVLAAVGAGFFASRYGREAVSLAVVAVAILGPLAVVGLLPVHEFEGSAWADEPASGSSSSTDSGSWYAFRSRSTSAGTFW